MLIDANTHLYAVFGNPVGHSKSPAIHNACFRHHNLNAVYLAFKINDIKECINAVRQLSIKGASITIPFKTSVMPYLDEISPDAQKIGAVNTIVNQEERLIGYNTDSLAAVLPLLDTGITDKNVCIIGAGGAAQAVAFGIKKKSGNIIIVNRSPDAGRKLADLVDGDFIHLADENQLEAQSIDILINTTPVGMFPDINAMPVSDEILTPGMIVMDIVYNPVQTRLLQQARKKRCRTVDGRSMFVHQGAAQFKLWTGIAPDIKLMYDALTCGDN